MWGPPPWRHMWQPTVGLGNRKQEWMFKVPMFLSNMILHLGPN